MEWRAPTVANVLEARRRSSPHPRPTGGGLRLREQLAGRQVALILSGGKASREQLLDALGHRPPPPLEAPRETLSASS